MKADDYLPETKFTYFEYLNAQVESLEKEIEEIKQILIENKLIKKDSIDEPIVFGTCKDLEEVIDDG